MGTSGRREYEPTFKLACVLALLKGEKTQAQICRERGIADDLVSRWQDIFQERAPGTHTHDLLPRLGIVTHRYLAAGDTHPSSGPFSSYHRGHGRIMRLALMPGLMIALCRANGPPRAIPRGPER